MLYKTCLLDLVKIIDSNFNNVLLRVNYYMIAKYNEKTAYFNSLVVNCL
jgi:hypothetical protein